jgi:hypothetical protein
VQSDHVLASGVLPSTFTMVRPRICLPDAPAYGQLADFWDGELDQAHDGIWKASVVYKNDREQSFDVAVLGQDRDHISAYINATKVCLEVAQLDEGEDPLVMVTTEEDLEPENEEPQGNALDGASNLLITMDWRLARDLSGWARFFNHEIVSVTEATAFEDLLSHYSRFWPEVSVRWAQFGTSPEFADWFLTWLQDPSGNHPIFVPLSRDTTLHFAFDPPINDGQTHAYKEHCSVKNARVRIKLDQNSAQVALQRTFPDFLAIGARSARQPNKTNWIPSTNAEFAKFRNEPARFDVTVTGLENNSLYTIEGGWTLGSGCQ